MEKKIKHITDPQPYKQMSIINMISLKEYLNIINKKVETPEYDNLDESVLEHCYIHYQIYHRHPAEYYITESDGAFPGEHELVNHILKYVKDNYNNDYPLVITDTGVDIVKQINLIFKTTKENSFYLAYKTTGKEYDYNQIRWDSSKKQFRFIEIFIYNYDKDLTALRELLYHEFKHMWDDYISITKKGYFLSDKVKKSLSYKLNKNNITDTIKELTYYSEDYEISAYIAQINGLFNGKKFDSVKDAFDEIIKKSSVYNNYKYLYAMVNTDEYLDKLKQYMNDKDINKCKRNINNAWKKIINHTYIICSKHLHVILERCCPKHLINFHLEPKF